MQSSAVHESDVVHVDITLWNPHGDTTMPPTQRTALRWDRTARARARATHDSNHDALVDPAPPCQTASAMDAFVEAGGACATSAECEPADRCLEGRCLFVDENGKAHEPYMKPGPPPLTAARYGGTSVRALAGAGLEGRAVVAYGQDLYFGARVLPWLSLEVAYGYAIQDGASSGAATGKFCQPRPGQTWFGDSFRWQMFAVRSWFHVFRSARFVLSVAPVLATGFASDHTSYCAVGNVVAKSGLFEGSLSVAGTVWLTRGFGIRVSADAAINIGVDVAEVSGWLGPIVRWP